MTGGGADWLTESWDSSQAKLRDFYRSTENQRMIYAEVIETANSLVTMLPLLAGSTAQKDYKDALALTEYLPEHQSDSPLVDILTEKIEQYENNSPEFAAFNQRVANIPGDVALLRTLIDQYQLTQNDFAREIGSKSLVSRILNGQRTLTLEHMRALAKRFDLPVSAFIDD